MKVDVKDREREVKEDIRVREVVVKGEIRGA